MKNKKIADNVSIIECKKSPQEEPRKYSSCTVKWIEEEIKPEGHVALEREHHFFNVKNVFVEDNIIYETEEGIIYDFFVLDENISNECWISHDDETNDNEISCIEPSTVDRFIREFSE